MIDDEYIRLAAQKLREVHGIRSVKVSRMTILFVPRGRTCELSVQLESEEKPYVLQADLKGAFDQSVIDRILQEIKVRGGNELEKTLIVAPYVNPSLAEYMSSSGLNFIDLAGNVRLALGKYFFVFVKGKKLKGGSPYIPKAKIAGLQVIFTILADASVLHDPVRTIAEKAGVGKTSVASKLTRLEKDGLIGKTSKGWQIIRRDELMGRWLTGYTDVIAPRIFNGQYRSRISDPDQLETEIEDSLKEYPDQWAWGGLSAAWRMEKHYRGNTSTLHIPSLGISPAIVKMFLKIEALPSTEGNLIFMRPLGPLSMKGLADHLVHPLLVYTQLITSSDPRARETALEIKRFLPEEK